MKPIKVGMVVFYKNRLWYVNSGRDEELDLIPIKIDHREPMVKMTPEVKAQVVPIG